MLRSILTASVFLIFFLTKYVAQKAPLIIKDSIFVNFFKQYVKDNSTGDPIAKGTPVLLMIKQTTTSCEMGLTMFASLSEFDKKPPSNYTFIDNRLTLLYDGTQHMFERDSSWIKTVKSLAKRDLCDDTLPLPKIPSKGEVALPSRCYIKYDPQDWKLIFANGKFVKQQSLNIPLFDFINK